MSIYAYDCLDKVWNTINNFKGGNAVFTQPNAPFKCGGAPQKIMYLAEDRFIKNGIRNKANVYFFSPRKKIFPVKKYARELNKVIKRKNIITKFRYDLLEILPETKKAVFEQVETGKRETICYAMLHVTPPMGAPEFIRNSKLSDESGWLDVNPYTLQHNLYQNVFGLGDAAKLTPMSKTGAAIRKQVPVVVKNLISLINERPLEARYNGYTSCPVITGYGKVILTEFDYHFKPAETFPINQAKERYSMYLLEKNILPWLYWHGMLKGRF